MTSIDVRGVKYDLLLTNGALAEIADICPEGDLAKLNEAMAGKGRIKNISYMIAAMSKGAELAKEYDAKAAGKDYAPRALGINDLLSLPAARLGELAEAVKTAIKEGTETQVQLEPAKKKDESTS